AFSAIALFSATTGPPPPGTPMAEDYDRRGDPGFTFEVGQAPVAPAAAPAQEAGKAGEAGNADGGSIAPSPADAKDSSPTQEP
ncbi:MAG: hypothetical protein LBF40_00955, partial [Deltaproteobacteria bacterium]|nr:hypothetical protein [Deltaproteobacteria bacterium]